MVTAQAFSKARGKLKPEVFESLNQTLQQQLDSLGLRQTWRGLRVLAVDGSTVHLPLESVMTRFFGCHSEFPVARLSMLYDVADGQTPQPDRAIRSRRARLRPSAPRASAR